MEDFLALNMTIIALFPEHSAQKLEVNDCDQWSNY